MTQISLPLPSRLWLAWLSFFRILFDGQLAAKVARLSAGEPESLPVAPSPTESPRPAPAVSAQPSAEAGALQLLSLLQREGRFVDFVQQDVVKFSDAEIGAAARLVHDGCRRALLAHAQVVSVRHEAEGAPLTLDQATPDVKLVGNVAGSAPFRGVLRHRGWRVERLSLPQSIGAHDPRLVAAAELELS
jgi:Domain of unknown function (DUF2760)